MGVHDKSVNSLNILVFYVTRYYELNSLILRCNIGALSVL